MVHVLLVGTWPSRSCIKDSAMSNSAVIQRSSRHPGRRCVRWSQRWFEDHGESCGVPHLSSTLQPVELPTERAGPSAGQRATRVSFGALSDDQMSIAASEGEPSLQGWRPGCVAPFGCGSIVRARPREDGYDSRAAENVGLVWNPPPRPIFRGWMNVFSVGVTLVLSAPLRCHSSRKCMRSSQDRGRHLLLPETNLVAPPPSPPSMVGPLWGMRASPWWSGLWPCNCVQQPQPLCGVIRVSPHGPVSICQV